MALTRVLMPKTGAEMEEGRIVSWKRNEGERIEKGEILLEIETDKATMELEAPVTGLVLKRLYNEGAMVPAARLIAIMGDGNEPSENFERLRQSEGEASQGQEQSTSVDPAPPVPAASAGASGKGGIKASPLARRLASERGIDLASIQGTGPGGRIEKDDLIRATAKAAKISKNPELIPLSPMRRAIARRVSLSKQEVPDFSVTMAMDMTAALQRKKQLQNAGKRLSINDLLVFAVSRTLVSHPDLSAQLEGDALRRHPEINVGLAVGTDDGLYVPVIRNSDKLSLEEIAGEAKRLADKAEKKQLTEEDMAGGTFTVSNLGMFGVESFTAIVVAPQSSILSVGCVEDRPLRDNSDKIAWQPTMVATLTVDHRVVDGLGAAKFLRDLKAQLATVFD